MPLVMTAKYVANKASLYSTENSSKNSLESIAGNLLHNDAICLKISCLFPDGSNVFTVEHCEQIVFEHSFLSPIESYFIKILIEISLTLTFLIKIF